MSTETAGPSSPNTYATRPDSTLAEFPVIKNPSEPPAPSAAAASAA